MQGLADFPKNLNEFIEICLLTWVLRNKMGRKIYRNIDRLLDFSLFSIRLGKFNFSQQDAPLSKIV